MARLKVPYPPSPTNFPDELTDPDHDSGLNVAAVLAGLFLFLFIYLGLIVGSLAVIIVMMTSLSDLSYKLLWIVGSVIAAIFMIVLLKGLFIRRGPPDKLQFEITEEDQPIFFAFIRRLTGEVGAPMPHRVILTFDVNAAMQQEISLVNLFVPPKKNLIVGLGLVNALNLSEFKAVMGHEFGHFTQKNSATRAYTVLAMSVILNLLTGEDWLDRMVAQAHRHARYNKDFSGLIAGLFAWTIGGTIWCCRKIMLGLFYTINFTSLALSRKNEFHADRIAVSVAGSNAIVHALSRLHFAGESLAQAIEELKIAADRKQYSNDLYYHQSASAHYLRKIRKKPHLGEPPDLESPEEGRDVRVFDPDEESEIPEMWSTHPNNFDREENAKEIFVAAPIDERSPWILFQHRDEIREEMTYRFYRHAFQLGKKIDLTAAEEIQGSIDDEHEEMTFDDKYRGAYDQRNIFPGEIDELHALVDAEPWDNERIERVHSRLYRELGRRVEDFADTFKAMRKIQRRCFGQPRGRDKRELEELQDEFKGICDWFKSFDRRVFLVHAQMAKVLGPNILKEMIHRYRFHLELQIIDYDLTTTRNLVEDFYAGLVHFGDNAPMEFIHVAMEVFRDARQTMKRSLKRAHEMLTPAMANVKKGTRLERLIFDLDMLKPLPETYVKGSWIELLLYQLGYMHQRVSRMHFKSLGAILQMQDRIAKEWLAATASEAILLEAIEPPALPPRRQRSDELAEG